MTWMMNIKVLGDDPTLPFWKVLNRAEPAIGLHLHLKCHMTPGGMFSSLGIYAVAPPQRRGSGVIGLARAWGVAEAPPTSSPSTLS